MWSLDISAKTNLKFAQMYKHSKKKRRKSQKQTTVCAGYRGNAVFTISDFTRLIRH